MPFNIKYALSTVRGTGGGKRDSYLCKEFQAKKAILHAYFFMHESLDTAITQHELNPLCRSCPVCDRVFPLLFMTHTIATIS